MFLGLAVSSFVWKVASSPLWSGKIAVSTQSQKSRRIHLSRKIRETLFLSCAVSASVWKIAPSPSWFGKLRRLCPGHKKKRAVYVLVARDLFRVAPSLPRSGKSLRLRLGLESCIVSAYSYRAVFISVAKVAKKIFLVAPFPFCFGKSCSFHPGLKTCASSAWIAKFAPHWHWSRSLRGYLSWSHRLRFGLEINAVSALVSKVTPSLSWSRKMRALSTLIAKVARDMYFIGPSLPGARVLRHLCLLESCAVAAMVAKFALYPPWTFSGFRRLRLENSAVPVLDLKIWPFPP